MLWKGLTLPNLSGADLHGHLDESVVTPEKTITEGEGDKAVVVPNPVYHRWWIQDQRVLGLLLSSMEPEIACQLIGCKTGTAVWTSSGLVFFLPATYLTLLDAAIYGLDRGPPISASPFNYLFHTIAYLLLFLETACLENVHGRC
jgi:hypothetical protein